MSWRQAWTTMQACLKRPFKSPSNLPKTKKFIYLYILSAKEEPKVNA